MSQEQLSQCRQIQIIIALNVINLNIELGKLKLSTKYIIKNE